MKDRVVLITGGAGTLGQTVCRAFLEANARVAVPFYRTDSPSALDALRKEYPERLYTFALDLTTERGAEQALRQVVEWGGSVSSVAHLVGGYSGGSRVAETPLDQWHRMIDLNLTSAFLIARFAIPRILESGGGSLVFVSSRAAYQGLSGRAAYAASKAGLITLAKAIAEEYSRDGIRSNVVIPDSIDTEANRSAQPDADYSTWASTGSIARVIVFLASGAATAINGAAIPVYGPG